MVRTIGHQISCEIDTDSSMYYLQINTWRPLPTIDSDNLVFFKMKRFSSNIDEFDEFDRITHA